MLEERRKTLWVALVGDEIIAFGITEVVQYPKALVLEINWTGGVTHRGRAWINNMMDMFKLWGRHTGCVKLGGGGRRGWLDLLGFRENGIMFEMDL